MKKHNYDPVSALKAFAEGSTPIITADFDEIDITLHDDLLLPFECRSYDAWAEGDFHELLGHE